MKLRTNILFLIAAGLSFSGFSLEQPLLRAGIMTDTHIGKTEEKCQNIRNAFLFFKKQNIDLMIHTGDIADRHYPEGYAIARRYFNEIFGEKKPKEIWVYAFHDSLGFKGDWMKNVKQSLQAPNDSYDKLVMKGYPFLVIPQNVYYAKMEKMIRDAVRDYPGKPVFVIDHVPPDRTTENSIVWGEKKRREMLDKYPQVIHLSGHTHNSLRNERCIWQGNFTAVNCGTLAGWSGALIANSAKSKKTDEVIIMEVFPERIFFRCYSLKDGKEIRPDHPWCVTWPFDPANAPYNPEQKVKRSPKPVFAQDAKIIMTPDKEPFTKLTFTFPEAKHPDRCYRYNLTLNRKNRSGKWEVLSFKDCFSAFHLEQVPETVSTEYQAGFFDENGEYKLSVVPLNFYGGAGKTLELEFRAPKPQKGTTLFECANPMKELPFMTKYTGGEPVKKEGSNYLFTEGEARLVFPEKIWEGKKGTSFRFIIDFSIEQPEYSSWLVCLRHPEKPIYATPRFRTPEKSSRQRTVFEVTKKSDDDSFCFLVRDGYWGVLKNHPGKIAFEYVRIEKQP